MSVKSVLEGIKPDEKLIQDTEELLRSKITQKKFSLNKLIAAACLPIMIGALSFSAYVCNRPVAYISFDVNPSLELEINRFDRVVDVNYFNDDARDLVSEKELYFLKPADAVNLIIKEVNKKGYLSDSETSFITIATNSIKLDKSIRLQKECTKNIQSYSKPISVISYTVSESLKKEADSRSLSFGKLKLIKVILQLNKSATIEGLKDASITSIMNDIYYLISDENTDVDDNTKERIRSYINSIQTNVDTDFNSSNQIDTKAQTDVTTDQLTAGAKKVQADTAAMPTATGAAKVPADTSDSQITAGAAKIQGETPTAKAGVEAPKAQSKVPVNTDASTAGVATEATKAQAEADAAQAVAEATKAQAEADAAQATAEATKAQAEAAAAQAVAEATKAQAEADAAQATAEATKAQAEADAAQATAEATKAQAEAAAAQAAAEAAKAQAEADAAQAAAEAAEAAKAQAEAAAAQAAAEAAKAQAEADAAQAAAEAAKAQAEADAAAAQ